MDEQKDLLIEEQLELLKTTHNMLAEATSEYLDKLKSLSTTYKREFALMNVAVVAAVHMPGIDGLKMNAGDFSADDMKATGITGHKDIIKAMLEQLTAMTA